MGWHQMGTNNSTEPNFAFTSTNASAKSTKGNHPRPHPKNARTAFAHLQQKVDYLGIIDLVSPSLDGRFHVFRC